MYKYLDLINRRGLSILFSLDPHSYPSNLSLLFLERNDRVYLFTAVWNSVLPDMVDSYSIMISQAAWAVEGNITTHNITTYNSSIPLELLSQTNYNITITTSYCPGINIDDSSSTFSIGIASYMLIYALFILY